MENMTEKLTPKKIVAELDRYIVGQSEAKKAVAIALRNRWRRMQLDENLKDEVLPKNILMIGTTGVGKTEIARRLAKFVQAPFIKVEATKFTEIGYVGRDVEQIIRDLVEISIGLVKQKAKEVVFHNAKEQAEERILDALTGKNAGQETRLHFKKKLQDGEIDDQIIEINISENNSNPQVFEVPGVPQMGIANLGEMFSQVMGKEKQVCKKITVESALKILIQEESDKLLDQNKITNEALESVQQNGIVFIDEIDKICVQNSEYQSSSVSREGVQRDLLPLIEGTNVATKYGQVKTEHILFIASGAFQVASPSNLLPELQGRLPIRVDLHSLSKADFIRILKEPEANLICQAKALLETEGVHINFDDGAIEEIASIAVTVNNHVENIGARRLYTIIENLLSDLNFCAEEHIGETINIDKEFVKNKLADIIQNNDFTRFIL